MSLRVLGWQLVTRVRWQAKEAVRLHRVPQLQGCTGCERGLGPPRVPRSCLHPPKALNGPPLVSLSAYVFLSTDDVRQHQAVSSKWSLPSRSVSALLKAPFADGQKPFLLPISHSHAAKSQKWILTAGLSYGDRIDS